MMMFFLGTTNHHTTSEHFFGLINCLTKKYDYNMSPKIYRFFWDQDGKPINCNQKD